MDLLEIIDVNEEYDRLLRINWTTMTREQAWVEATRIVRERNGAGR